MKFVLGAALAALLGGCAVTSTGPAAEPAPLAPSTEGQRHQGISGAPAAQETAPEGAIKGPMGSPKVARSLAAQDAAKVTRRQQAHEALAATCAASRPEREAETAKHEASLQRKQELKQWENDHCTFADNSKAVVRVGQDPRGEYHAYEGRDRGVDRKCNAKLPKELESMWADYLPVHDAPSSSCEEVDREAAH